MIDKNKTYKTRDGKKVRIYATDGEKEYPVHGAIKLHNEWMAITWTAEGKYCGLGGDDKDLIEVKPRIQREYWVNVYPDNLGFVHLDRAQADEVGFSSNRIACVKITIDCEEGEGLDNE